MFSFLWLLFMGVVVGITPPMTPLNDQVTSECGNFLLSSHPIVTDDQSCKLMKGYGVVLPPFYSTDQVDFKFDISALSDDRKCYRGFILHLGPSCQLKYENSDYVRYNHQLEYQIKQKGEIVTLVEEGVEKVSSTCNGSLVDSNQLNIKLESLVPEEKARCRFEWDGIIVYERSMNSSSFYADPMAEEDHAVQVQDVKDYEDLKNIFKNFLCTQCFVIAIALAVFLCIFLALCVCSSCVVCKLKKDLQGRDWVDNSFKRKKSDNKSSKSKREKSQKSKKRGKEISKKEGSKKETAKDSAIPSSSTDGKDSKQV